jgi:large subunit ribosomal protein L13
MRTHVPRKERIQQRWLLVDASGQTLGRLSTFVAARLMGKHRPDFSRSVDTGDFVVIVNAEKIRLTGKKPQSKVYRSHTGYPGGLRQVPVTRLFRERPERVLEMSIQGMLPKNRLGRKMRTKLKVYTGAEHPHQAQKPEPVRPPDSGGRS